ncbi:MAG TPA: radical SAM protein [Anaerolineae bacterium]|nr:radical SAM protein [Anaerolineae bacterium]
MDLHEKVQSLTQDARFDVCAPGSATGFSGQDHRRWIAATVLAGGRVEHHLKILLSNACERDCAYCANRNGRSFRRTSFEPEELARAFHQMWSSGLVTGLFLSSAVRGSPALTMEREIAAVEILRTKHQFRGYVHLKLMPGTDRATVERALELADRVSVNLEAPNPGRLARLTGKKDFYHELLTPLRWVNEIRERRGPGILRSGSTTQFVVGASSESDEEILSTVSQLYGQLGLARAYYSAFRPVVDTPLQDHPATTAIRERRLYQSDFLLRHYGFRLQDLTFDESGNLPTETDPKTLAALQHPGRFPVEINRASREELLRVPGIGPRSAEHILQMRCQGALRSLGDLARAGASASRAAPFILLDGRQPPTQPRLI